MKDVISINRMHMEFMQEQCCTARKPCKKWFAWLEKQTLVDLRTTNLGKNILFDLIERRVMKDTHRHDFRTPASLIHHSYAESYDHLITGSPKVIPFVCPLPMYDENSETDLLIPAEVSDFFWDWDNAVFNDESLFDLLNA